MKKDNLFSTIKKLHKTIETFKEVTSGRHTGAPGKNATEMMPHPEKATQPEKHIRADTMTHMDLRYELGKSRDKLNIGKFNYAKLKAVFEKLNKAEALQIKPKVSTKVADTNSDPFDYPDFDVVDDFEPKESSMAHKDKHSIPNFDEHHDLYHGTFVNKPLMSKPETFTTDLSFVGDASGKPKSIIKGPIIAEDMGRNDDTPGNEMSHFAHPTFKTTHREATYHKLADNVFGLGKYIPRTTVFSHPDYNSPWSAMEFIPNAEHIKDPENDLAPLRQNGDLHKMAIMNTILGNHDRHVNNIMKSPKGIHLIDHGFTFDYNHITTDINPKYAEHAQGDQVPEGVHNWLWGLDVSKMANMLSQSGAPDDIVKTAAGRLADARKWSQDLRLGKIDKSHNTLHTLYQILRARRPSIDPELRYDIQSKITSGKGLGRLKRQWLGGGITEPTASENARGSVTIDEMARGTATRKTGDDND